MADFSDTQLDPVSPRGEIRSPVTDKSGQIIASTIGNVADFLGDGVGDILARRRENKLQGVIGRFIDENLKLAHATDQGKISSQEARMRSRALISETIANNPSIAADVIKAQKDLMSTAGLGQVMDEGTKAEQRYQSMLDSAYADGFVTNASDEGEGLSQYRNYLNAQRELKALKDNMEIAQKKQTYKKGEIELFEKEKQIKSRQAISALAGSYNYKFNKDVEGVLNRLEAKSISAEDAMKELDLNWNTVMATVNAAGGDAGNDYVSNVVAPMKFAYEQGVKYVNGEITKDIFVNRLEQTQALAKLNLLSDPEIANAVATNQLLRNLSPSSLGYFDGVTIKMLKKNSDTGKPTDLTSTDKEEKRSSAIYLNAVKDSMKTSASKNFVGDGEEFNATVGQNVNQIIKSINAYSDSVESPTEYNEIVDFIASPEMGSYLTSTNGQLNADVAEKAKEVLQQQYGDVVLPLIQNEYKEASSIVGYRTVGSSMSASNVADTQEVESLIEPVFQGSGVVFRLRPGVKDIDVAGGAGVQGTLRTLNKDVAPTLNRLIRMTAHLSGNTDYKAAYTNFYAGAFEGDPTKTADTTNNQLGLNSKQNDQLGTALQNTPDELSDYMSISLGEPRVQEAIKIGNDSKSYLDIASAFTGLDERNSEDNKVLSEFFRTTAGTKINPAKTAWCAAFVNSVLATAGDEGTGSLSARSFLNWGQSVDEPKQGDVVVFSRGNSNVYGHVGFYVGEDENNIMVLGGNQSGGRKVSISTYPKEKLIGIRRGEVPRG